MDRAGVERLVEQSSWSELLGWAGALDGDDVAEARRWYRSWLRALARKNAEHTFRTPARSIQIGLAVALAETPEEASRGCRWGRSFAWTDDEGSMPLAAALLVARGREWAGELVELATAVELRGESRRAAAEIAALSTTAVAALDLPVPAAGTYALGWTQLVSSACIASHPRRRGGWTPLRPASPGNGIPAPAYGLPTTLYDVLAATPKLPETLAAALATPDALVEWNGVTGDGWDVADTVSRLVASGRLDRTRVVADCLAALTRSDKPSAQRVVGQLLRGASFGAADVGPHEALLGHLMPGVHGSVSAVLLEAVLDAGPADAMLLDIGTVVLSRKEKAQKRRLLDRLVAGPGSETVTTLLTIAAADDDTAFAARAWSALPDDERGAELTAPGWQVAWEVPVTGRSPVSFRPWSPDEAGLDAARSDVDTWTRITSNAGWLDLVVRYAHHDLRGLRRAVTRGPELTTWSASRVPPLLQRWCRTGNAHDDYTSTPRSMRRDPDTGEMVVEEMPQVTIRPPGYVVLTDRLTEETLSRLGRVRGLLSTPTHEDGSVTLDDLVDRVRAARSDGVAAYDLVQALLRLEPTVPADATRFDRLTVAVSPAPGRRRLLPRRRAGIDAAAVIRDWIRAGGLPAREVSHPGGVPHADPVSLPLPRELARLEGLDWLCGPITDDRACRLWWGAGEVGHYLGVVPRWADSAAALLERSEQAESVFRGQSLSFLTAAAGDFGDGVHHLLATMQGHPRQDSRLTLVEQLMEIARQGRLDPVRLRDQSVAAYAGGGLPLRRLGHTWEQVGQAGGLRWVWPAAMGVLDLACSADRKPAGLADLLRALIPLAPTALARPDGDPLPRAVHRVAAEKGPSKAVAEARALVAAVSGVAS